MSFGRASVVALGAAFALSVVGCGRIEYGDDAPEQQVSQPSRPATAGGVTYVVAPSPPPQPAPSGSQRMIVVVPGPQAQAQAQTQTQTQTQAPSPPAASPAPAAPALPSGLVVCSGNQRLRIDDRVIDGEEGAAIVATGNCVVEVYESIVRGQPAVHVSGNAQVHLVECRVRGDLASGGAARIHTRGTAHRGRVLRHAF
jgi:hypothetical protein